MVWTCEWCGHQTDEPFRLTLHEARCSLRPPVAADQKVFSGFVQAGRRAAYEEVVELLNAHVASLRLIAGEGLTADLIETLIEKVKRRGGLPLP